MNDAFWRDLACAPSMALPRWRAVARWGAAAVDDAERVGLLDAVSFEDGERYPCACGACEARLVCDGERWLVAGIGALACADEVAPSDADLGVHVSPARFVRALVRALGLSTTPSSSWTEPVWLGTRSVGGRRVGFMWAPRPALAQQRLRWLAQEDPDRDLVVIVAHTSVLPADGASTWGRVRVSWLDLASAVRRDQDQLSLDLADVALAGPTPDGGELWPRYALVVDETAGRAWWGGRPLLLERTPLGARMLFELARRPGMWVSRRDLMLALWPEEFSARTKAPVDPIALDRRLRQLRSALGEVFRAVEAASELPVDPVENLRTRSDIDGGYRLAVASTQIWNGIPATSSSTPAALQRSG